jgi:hypothetical protein
MRTRGNFDLKMGPFGAVSKKVGLAVTLNVTGPQGAFRFGPRNVNSALQLYRSLLSCCSNAERESFHVA